MPLINLKTKYKSLKFSDDRLGNGYSGQPYNQFPIPDLGTASELDLRFYQNNRNNLDFPIRGGSVNLTSGLLTSTINSQLDYQRIKSFLSDNPRGSTFITKQIGLQLTNPKSQTGQALGTNPTIQQLLSGQVGFGILGNNRVYNGGVNTLTQVSVAGTGIHLPRAGLLPIDFNSKYYLDIVGNEKNIDQSTITKVNRLLILKNLKLQSQPELTNINKINQLGLSLNKNILFQYLGGPGSTYGIGSTIIKRYDDTSQGYNNAVAQGALTFSYDQIFNKSKKPTNNTDTIVKRSKKTVSDFRQDIPEYKKLNPGFGHYYNQEDTIDYRFYTSGSGIIDYVDRLNKNPLGDFSTSDPYVDPKENDDLIKFGFECMSNDIPDQSLSLIFRAFLTSGITDNNSAQLDNFKYAGRGETFYTYQGFERSIGFSFKIAAFSQDEMLPLYNKLNYLISQVYPDYSSSGIMRAPLVKVTIGDYLYRVPGFLETVNITVDNNYPWEIFSDRINKIAQLPKVLDINISFKPIHNKLPQRMIGKTGMALIANNPIDYITTSEPYKYANMGTYNTDTGIFENNKPIVSNAPQQINNSNNNALNSIINK